MNGRKKRNIIKISLLLFAAEAYGFVANCYKRKKSLDLRLKTFDSLKGSGSQNKLEPFRSGFGNFIKFILLYYSSLGCCSTMANCPGQTKCSKQVIKGAKCSISCQTGNSLCWVVCQQDKRRASDYGLATTNDHRPLAT
jgi:hypothetical protein